MNLKKFLVENPFGIILLAIISGIATNLLSSFAPYIFPLLGQNINVQIWTLFLLFFLGSFLAVIPFLFILKIRKKANKELVETKEKLNIEIENHALTKADYDAEKRIIEIDKRLLDSISKLAKGNDPGSEFDVLTTNVIQIISNINSLAECGISVFCPDPDDKNFLVSYKACFTESQATMRFYIGDGKDERSGVAGEVFRKKDMQIVHIDTQQDGRCTSDNIHYHIFPGLDTPKYKSFICAPIKDTDGNCLGVLSIDSKNRDAFDSNKSQEFIRIIASRFAAILLIVLNSPAKLNLR